MNLRLSTENENKEPPMARGAAGGVPPLSPRHTRGMKM
jgi:hypothetical protein